MNFATDVCYNLTIKRNGVVFYIASTMNEVGLLLHQKIDLNLVALPV